MMRLRHGMPTIGTCLVCALLLSGCGSGSEFLRANAQASLVEPAPDPRNDRGMYLGLIRKMQEQGAWYASLAHIEAHRQKYPDSPDLRLLEAHALRETGQHARARSVYEGLTSGPSAAPAWHGLGLIAAKGGDGQAASEAFARAVRLDPLHEGYLGDLGFSLLRSGRIADARTPLAKAAELAPSNGKAVANLALWAMLAGQPAQAESIMQRADLPANARTEVYRLAAELRQSAATRPAAPAVAAAPKGGTPAAATGATPMPPTLLERFNGATLRNSSETTP